MLIKLDHFPANRGENTKIFELPPPRQLPTKPLNPSFKTVGVFFPLLSKKKSEPPILYEPWSDHLTPGVFQTIHLFGAMFDFGEG